MISGLGVAVADTFFSLAAGFGVEYVKVLIQSYGSIMHISGASLILIFGILMFAGKFEIDLSSVPEGRSRRSIINAFMPNFLFTALHPITLVFFSAAFASFPLADSTNQLGFGPLELGQLTTVAFISLGVFSGAMIWWMGLAWSVDKFIRNRMTTSVLIKIKRSFAAILLLLGAGMLINYTLFA